MKKSSPLLSLQNLSTSFKTETNPIAAVKNVSFDIYPQETVALVGESGSGKSVTAYSILQLLPYPKAFHPQGSILWKDQELIGAPLPLLQTIRGNQIGMIFQEPMTSLNPLHTIEQQINESLFLHGSYTRKTAQARVLELLHLVRLRQAEKRLNAYPFELSGGERQRVMIAMALAHNPQLLIADEPTTALDVTIQAEILELLKDLQHDLKMSILLITHDLDVVRKMAQRTCVMHQGEIIESGLTSQILKHPKKTYTQMLIAAEPKGKAVPLSKDAYTLAPLVKVQNLSVSFPLKKGFFGRVIESHTAVNKVSFFVNPGETLGIVGESGSGKSSLGFALLRLLKSEGKIWFDSEEIQDKGRQQLQALRPRLQIVFQDPYSSLSPRLSVSQIIGEGLWVHHLVKTEQEADEKILKALLEVGLDETFLWRYPHELSGGQRQRISLARALILKPKLIILDEPTSALDRSIQAQLLDLLKKLQSAHKISYIFISHDLKVIQSLSHRVLVLKEGKIVEEGTTTQIFHHPQTPYTQALLKAAF
ncbi:MAG: ABC transporter ATP-binding protein [Proteobacteria bacterium]|nr:ABC transporter ATP-binding protein [Pseudomonadota bacterium]